MSPISTPAIMLRRVEYGDYDLIITFFSLYRGKISLIAKSAKKSTKRFSGILEPFSVLQLVYSVSRRKGLPVLQEASLIKPFSNIRLDIKKMAYAGYMAELINEWVEEKVEQASTYALFQYALEALDQGDMHEDALSILFQMRFMGLSGFRPNLNYCSLCRTRTENIHQQQIVFDLTKGGLVCDKCLSAASRQISLSKGTIKQLLWVERGDLRKATRIRFSSLALQEGLAFLETFVPFHLGKEPRSLQFLKQLRK